MIIKKSILITALLFSTIFIHFLKAESENPLAENPLFESFRSTTEMIKSLNTSEEMIEYLSLVFQSDKKVIDSSFLSNNSLKIISKLNAEQIKNLSPTILEPIKKKCLLKIMCGLTTSSFLNDDPEAKSKSITDFPISEFEITEEMINGMETINPKCDFGLDTLMGLAIISAMSDLNQK